MLLKSEGAAGEDPVVEVQAAEDAAGTGAVTMDLGDLRNAGQSAIYRKQGANLQTIPQWSEAHGDLNGAGAWTRADAGEQQLMLALLIRPDELDALDGEKTHVRLRIADVGNTPQYAACAALALSRWSRRPELMPSIIG